MRKIRNSIRLMLGSCMLTCALSSCGNPPATQVEEIIMTNSETPEILEATSTPTPTKGPKPTKVPVSIRDTVKPKLTAKVVNGKMLSYKINEEAKEIELTLSRVCATPNVEPEISITTDAYKDYSFTTTYAGNPVLKGQFADPDIDIFNGKYYMYCTTDGFAGWSGTEFHCFSSDNLIDWKDEGIILNVASDDVAWSVGSAWAPTIEEHNGKYYFYFCAKLPNGSSSIGVAIADKPEGPYKAEPTPLITHDNVIKHGAKCGQAIDPSVFTEDDGSCYLLFGNGEPTVVKLNDDMISVDWSTLKNYEGAHDFREAITVTKRNGLYHFTWSCDDTGSENYHINYGISNSIYGPIEYKHVVLAKVKDEDILGTGHHCILNIPGTDDYYMVYHRFHTPLTTFTEGKGFHRETCIDVLTFNPETGLMNRCTPTMKGVEERKLK